MNSYGRAVYFWGSNSGPHTFKTDIPRFFTILPHTRQQPSEAVFKERPFRRHGIMDATFSKEEGCFFLLRYWQMLIFPPKGMGFQNVQLTSQSSCVGWPFSLHTGYLSALMLHISLCCGCLKTHFFSSLDGGRLKDIREWRCFLACVFLDYFQEEAITMD